MSVINGKKGSKKRWRGTQLTVIEVLVYPVTNKWAHAIWREHLHLLPRDVRKLPVFDNETLSANASNSKEFAKLI